MERRYCVDDDDLCDSCKDLDECEALIESLNPWTFSSQFRWCHKYRRRDYKGEQYWVDNLEFLQTRKTEVLRDVRYQRGYRESTRIRNFQQGSTSGDVEGDDDRVREGEETKEISCTI